MLESRLYFSHKNSKWCSYPLIICSKDLKEIVSVVIIKRTEEYIVSFIYVTTFVNKSQNAALPAVVLDNYTLYSEIKAQSVL